MKTCYSDNRLKLKFVLLIIEFDWNI